MATNTLIAAATTANNSADVTIAAAGELDVYLTSAAGREDIPATAAVLVQKKSGANYVTMLVLSKAMPSAKLKAAGVWRFKRDVQDAAVGVESET
jgi:hypothetical protein